MDIATIAALSCLVSSTSAAAGALIGAPIHRLRTCALLGLLLGPIGVAIALTLERPWGAGIHPPAD